MKGDNTAMKAVGKRIQYYRKIRGYTQEQFAEIVDLSTNYLSDVERGKSSARLDKLVLIMNKLECSADEIFADVVNTGFLVRSTRLSEEIEKLSPEQRNTAFSILQAYIDCCNK
ncbi:MAG: helix-turn-helix transcriptional regulator [Oscillospiraceae bacterium]|nr:helix-turn-helix transcriptional regulator [Candidatus Equicaccousia limihippi]